MSKRIISTLIITAVSLQACISTPPAAKVSMGREYTNTIGMTFVRIEPGTFMMGVNAPLPDDAVTFIYEGRYRESGITAPALWKGVRPGLVGVTYSEADLTGPRDHHRLEGPNFDLGNDPTSWSRRWRGQIKAPVTGLVTFAAETDRAVRLFIEGQPVINVWQDKKAYSGTVYAAKDQMLSVTLDYSHSGKQSLMRLYWSWQGQKKVLVPSGALWHEAQDYNLNLLELVWQPGSSETDHRLKVGDYDEEPRHKVTITRPFYMSVSEVTIDQFRRFQPDHTGYDEYAPYAAGVSWHDAVAFCKWLSRKDGQPYRLPTEAEWEYACRAGTTTPFSSGNSPPEPETANPWGLKNMHTNVLEWCYDWHGLYAEEPRTDPVGPERGWVKVTRGGGLNYKQWDQPYFARSANRVGMAPGFAPPQAEYQAKMVQGHNLPISTDTCYLCRRTGDIPGRHPIGFRVVLAAMPKTKPPPFEPPTLMRCVKQKAVKLKRGPKPDKPYYKLCRLFPIGLDLVKVGWKIGLEPGVHPRHHNSALAQLPNGDLLAFYYNRPHNASERDPDLSIVGLRLRYGALQWDLPSPWPDFLDANDEAPIIWNDNGVLWLFWGCPRMKEAYPFQWTTSKDNGATWGPIRFPMFETLIHPHSPQPINSAFRGPDGAIYVGVDGRLATSILFAGHDDGKTWRDPGGRTLGRHSTFVLLDDNETILCYGGKNADIEGFMPKNVSTDWGKTWHITKSPFSRLGGGQRPSLIRLSSGRLFYTADLRDARGRYEEPVPKAEELPKGYTTPGGYVGLSEDNGETWRVRKLVGADMLDPDERPIDEIGSVGYVTASQSADGLIHLITTSELHVTLNEAWILQDDTAWEQVLKEDIKIVPGTVKEYREDYFIGKVKVKWSAGTSEDGRYLLHGKETWYYENGQKRWEVNYHAGQKVDTETYWNSDGTIRWQWDHHKDGTSTWIVWDSDGRLKAESHWRGKRFISHRLGGEQY